MATKLAKGAPSTAHTSGIYADMTVDGPEIGTLVVVVDRARHLPNRKTVGKQDPYCAARLGKEAKKTETDKRGGQTPRWDQELRFTVYDSPDYYKLKLSLFNDDKKCDLIGESWIQLEDVVTPGGGQSDKWHTLHFKGKYAGEVQLELTFWDMRPREDPPKEARPAQKELTPEPAGPRGLQKRRPLPAEPGSTLQQQQRSFGPRDPNANHPQSAASEVHSDMNSQYGYDTQPPEMQPYGYDDQYAVELDDTSLPSHRQAQYTQGQMGPGGYHPSQQLYQGYDTRTQQNQILPAPSRGLELPELPPLAPRQQRGAQHSKHYSPLDRKEDSQYALPYYHQPNTARSMEVLGRPISRDSAQLRQQGPGRHYHDQGMRASMPPGSTFDAPPPPPPNHRRGSYGGPETYEPNAYSATALTADALRDPNIDDGLYLPPLDGTETQLSTRSAPLLGGYSNQSHRYVGYEPSNYDHEFSANGQQPPRLSERRSAQFEAPNHNPYQTPRRGPNVRPQASTAFETPPQQTRSGEHFAQRASVPLIKPQAKAPDHRSNTMPQGQGHLPHPPGPPHSHSMPTPPSRHSIPRKSVTPTTTSPASSLGGVAFSPDSFDVLNPNLHAARSINDMAPRFDTPEHHTPESARQAARERQREDSLAASGPIVDSSGRVIDPTDHLPSETWAPEPVKKVPRKSHEVRLKFRHAVGSKAPSSQGGSPSGSGSGVRIESPLRPHSMQAAMPMHGSPGMQHSSGSSPQHSAAHSPLSSGHPAMHSTGHLPMPPKNQSPLHQSLHSSPMQQQQQQHASPQNHFPESPTTGRNRLQKRGPAQSARPLPPTNSPGYGAPLREMGNPNYGYGNNSAGPSPGYAYGGGNGGAPASPGYGDGHGGAYGARSSPFANGAPPRPPKVPIGRGQEEWGGGRSSLSEEIGAIDLGAVRTRRTRQR